MGVGIFSLIAFILAILIFNVVFKRKISEAMILSYVVVLLIAQFSIGDVSTVISESVSFAFRQEVIFAAMAFAYMAYVMEKTGIVSRLVNILNSLLGRLAGGAGYVSTIASALFGMVSGSGSGNAAAVGSITIPWMKKTGWSTEDATTIVAGNAGLGIVFPPSSSMFILLGMPVIAAELDTSDLYLTLLSGALIILAFRLLVVFYYVKKRGIKPVPKEQRMPIKDALSSGWTSLLIFLGVLIPLVLTIGPLANVLEGIGSYGPDGLDSISLIMWIPILITIIALIEGRKYLPKTIQGWKEFNNGSIKSAGETGVLLFFAFAASNVLISLGLEEEILGLMNRLSEFSPLVVILGVALLILLMAGPFSGTATTTAVGSVSYMALRSIGISPAVAVSVILYWVSTEGSTPPSAAPIYIASGISGLERQESIYMDLIFLYAIPTVLLGILMAVGIIPLVG